jgi:hypothetical protein
LEILLQDLGVTTPRLWRKTPRPWSSNSKTLEKNSKTLETKLQNLGEKTPSNRELEKKKLQELGV